MLKREWFARLILGGALLVGASIPFIGRQVAARTATEALDIEMHARMPENGGWSVETIQARAGQPIHLRLTSDDALHSFAIGQSDRPAVDIRPGEYTETTLVFDQPGQYTFYCTHWCGPNHWRMRGTIVVTGDTAPQPTAETPLFLKLKLDLDAPHLASAVPNAAPDAAHGAALAAELPGGWLDPAAYKTSSPAQIWQRLRAEPALLPLSDADLWDLIAWVWQENTTPDTLAEGKAIYAQNCAACHGEQGKGDGVEARSLPPYDMENMGHAAMQPPDFTDPRVLLGASPALLEGKIIRGGMGTGMPYWGSILTQKQIDAVISYLYTLATPSLEGPHAVSPTPTP